MNDEQTIARDRMRFIKNSQSANLCYLGILLNVFYFISIYKSDVGTYYYNILIGASIVYNLIFMLAVFLSSEAVKNYNKNGNMEAILKSVIPAKKWAIEHNVPVIINEFGAYNLKTDKQSVLNYMSAMRTISDTLQIPLTHWGYTGGFALFDSEDGVKGTKLIEGMKEAYGL